MSIEALRNRIEALTQSISDLKKKLEDLKSGSAATSTPGTKGPHKDVCDRIATTGSFNRGMYGDGIRSIQEFLIEEGHLPKDSGTGYFGDATQRGLKEWQTKHGVLAAGSVGLGSFGVLTRTAMMKRCGDIGTTTPELSKQFRLSPQEGKAPLTVEVAMVPKEVLTKMNECVTTVGRMGSSGNGLTVDWGDGTISPVANASSSGQSCKNEVKKHTYATPGTYTVSVRSWHPGPTDAPVTDWEGTARVTVKATSTSPEKPVSKFIRAAQMARAALADKLDVKTKKVAVTKVVAQDWSDGCLGLGGAAESCLAAITPGYRVTLMSSSTTYYARTDTRGTVVRFEE